MRKFTAFLCTICLLLILSACAREETEIRFGAMKGPTGVGALHLFEEKDKGFTITPSIAGKPDAIVADLVSEKLDMALVPANLASVLYNKTQGEIQVAAVNNLGVLYLLEKGDTIQKLEDLKGREILLPGQGTNPEIILQGLLHGAGMDAKKDVTITYAAEATEAAQLLISGQKDLALLPEPMVSSVLLKNSEFRIAMSATEEWKKLHEGSPDVAAVLVVRRSFLEQIGAEKMRDFLSLYEESVGKAGSDPEKTAELAKTYDLMPAPVLKKALPNLHLQYMDGEEMKRVLEQFLSLCFEENPKFVGGKLPEDDFYYNGEN